MYYMRGASFAIRSRPLVSWRLVQHESAESRNIYVTKSGQMIKYVKIWNIMTRKNPSINVKNMIILLWTEANIYQFAVKNC